MRKFLGVVFIVLGVLTSVPALAVWSLRSTLLESAPWKAALREARVYERVLEELPAVILSDPESLGNAVTATPLSAADMAGVVQAIIPATLLQDTVERSLDVGLGLVNGTVPWESATLVVPLHDLKLRAPVEVQNLLVKKLQALPICTDAQLKQYTERKDLDGALPPCKPKNVDARALVASSVPVQEIAKAIPDTVDIFAELRKQASSRQPCAARTVQVAALADEQPCTTAGDPTLAIAEAQSAIRLSLQLHLLLTALGVAFFLGAFVIFLPNLRTSFRWFGVGLVIAGAVNLIAALQGRAQLGRTVTSPVDQLGQVLQSIFLPVARNVGNQVAGRFILLAALVLLVGGVSIAFSYAWKPKPKT